MTTLDLHTTRMAAGGDAVAREPSGRVVFVRGALPGEEVRVELTEEKGSYAKGTVTEVLVASPERIEPPCPAVAAGCGGCGWQHVDPAAQRVLKRGLVVESLTRMGRLEDPQVDDGPALEPWAFRTTVRLGADEHGRLGLRRARSHDVVVPESCAVAHPALVDLMARARLPGAADVVARCSVATGERVVLVEPDEAAADAVLPADVKVGPRAWLTEEVAGRRVRVSAGSFFQSRADGAEALVALVARAVEGFEHADTVVDAYAGVGLFSTCLPLDGRIIAIESSRSAVADAVANLEGRAADILRLDVARWRADPAELVIADPPRTGLGRKAVGALTATGAERLVLVSCDPVALGRDAALLAEAGYVHRRSTVVDLFPHTPHVEVVSRFDRIEEAQW